MIFGEAIDQQVVDDRSFRCSQRGVLRLAIDQFCRVVGSQPVNEGNRVRTAHVDLAHVRDVEQTGMSARAEMFSHCPRRVLDRHVPAAKLNHAPAQAAMRAVKRRLFEF